VQVQLKCAAQHVSCDRLTECKLQLHNNLYCKMKYIIVLIKEKGFPMKLLSIKR
jgi:hypothetical protein